MIDALLWTSKQKWTFTAIIKLGRAWSNFWWTPFNRHNANTEIKYFKYSPIQKFWVGSISLCFTVTALIK